MQPDIKQIILANINVKLCSCSLHFLQVSAAAYLRGGGSFN